MPRHHEDAGPVELPAGKVVGRRWKIVDKLGEGGCGAVYLVEDNGSQCKAAMKAESNFVAGGSVLKLEAQVLKRMAGRKFVAQLIASGKKEKYSYMVMTLFGPSLSRLFKQCNRKFSLSTQVRLGVHILYGLKQLHETGYIHRDIKPANLAVGRRGREARVLHLLDFGLSREYVLRENGQVQLRRPRDNCLFRGTTKYCSIKTHERCEQGRPDDLWSMMYVLAEMRGPLPWDHLRDKHDIGKLKVSTAHSQLLRNSPSEFLKILAHLETLTYEKRPDYALIHKVFVEIMDKKAYRFSDLYDWESGQNSLSQKSSKKGKGLNSVAEDPSVPKEKSEGKGENQLKTMDDPLDVERPLFPVEEFAKNELGF